MMPPELARRFRSWLVLWASMTLWTTPYSDGVAPGKSISCRPGKSTWTAGHTAAAAAFPACDGSKISLSGWSFSSMDGSAWTHAPQAMQRSLSSTPRRSASGLVAILATFPLRERRCGRSHSPAGPTNDIRPGTATPHHRLGKELRDERHLWRHRRNPLGEPRCGGDGGDHHRA